MFDPVESWIDSVAYSHSNSPGTAAEYSITMEKFCNFIGKTPEQILDDYEHQDEKAFKRAYAGYVKTWIGALGRQGFTNGTIGTKVNIVRSFFKYSDLPLAFVPIAFKTVVYHNRDIDQIEIEALINSSSPRERAFYAMMVQSGLRPNTLVRLGMKHLEPDFSSGRIPCKIDVPEEITKGKYGAYWTFIGPEAVKYLKAYFATRPHLNPESLVFCVAGHETKAVSVSSLSTIFASTASRLKTQGILKYEQKAHHKPAELRLYTLRKYFRKMAGKMGFEYVNFMMGHIVTRGADNHYISKDVEFYRNLYAEQAMPFLRIESATPTEFEKAMKDKDHKIAELEQQLDALERKVEDGQALRASINSLEERMRKVGDSEFVVNTVKEFLEKMTKEEQEKVLEPFRKAHARSQATDHSRN